VPDDDVDLSELDCKIFVDGVPNTTELIKWIAEAVDGSTTDDGARAPRLEMIAADNDGADPRAKLERKRGFLFFDHFVEIYFAPSVGLDRRVTEVSKVLEHLWGLGRPAVAACDYEDQLPRRAGTADTAPWPIDD
jgi:hypothetical protein